MPEIKHTFSAGKMNKDLDERLVPNGEYRDALNIRVSTSDASDVGALNNILGNTKIFPNAARTNSTFSLNANAQCVGAVSDEQNNCFYWFIQNAANSDLIIKWDVENETATPVLVDNFSTGGVLKFQRDNLITGINVIEGFLFWTDNYSEPKKINIENTMLGTPNFTRHTRLHNPILDSLLGSFFPGFTDSNEFIKEEHITVIKRAPYKEPTIELVSDYYFNQPGVIIEGAGNSRFSDGTVLWGPGNYPGSTSTSSTGNPDVNIKIFSSSQTRQYNIVPGETIIQLKSVRNSDIGVDFDSDGIVDELYANFNQQFSYNIDYDIRLKITSISNTQSNFTPGVPLGTWIDVHCEILTISPDTTLLPSTWIVKFERANDVLFENKFPRFAYRYKFIDGEYSPFSPFTKTAFNAGTYSQDTVRGYNLGMKNNLREVVLSEFISKDYSVGTGVFSKKIPHDVVGIDILYKESDSPIVYIVDSITPYNPSWFTVPASNNYGDGEYSITSETIYKATAANQLLRNFDSVPKKALAQEIVGNRLVYANYEQNIDLPDGPVDLEFTYRKNPNFDIVDDIGVPSVKTLRNYQLGVVYEDKYGRQTPVLTNTDCILNMPITESHVPNQFMARINSAIPQEAESFKFFIKETSTDYYNLALARWYDARDGNIWLSFISADRNKVDEEDYLYLKKQHGTDLSINDANKYKILAISNNAPDFIKTTKKKLGKLTHIASSPLFPDPDSLPLYTRTEFRVTAGTLDASAYKNILELRNRKVTFYDLLTDERTKTYDIANIVYDDQAGEYIINVERQFGSELQFMEDNSGSITLVKNQVAMEIVHGEVENKPEFDGKFFVKIYRDFNINKLILNYQPQTGRLATTHQESVFYYTGSDPALPCLDNIPDPPVDGPNAYWPGFSWQGGNDWETLSNGTVRRSSNSSYNHQDAYNDAKVFFGDGTSSVTSDPNGPKWFIDNMPYQSTWDPNLVSSNGLVHGYGGPPGKNIGIAGNKIDISFSGIIAPGWQGLTPSDLIMTDIGFLVGDASNPNHVAERNMVENMQVGKQFYFDSDPDKTLYTITDSYTTNHQNYMVGWELLNTQGTANYPSIEAAFMESNNRRKTWHLTLDKVIGANGTYDPTTASSPVSQTSSTAIKFVEDLEAEEFLSEIPRNPAIFETKPKNNNNLEIYHEISSSYDKTLHLSSIQFPLDFYNCFAFGNGVESDRIQDDFNAPTIDNGPKVSTIFEGDYKKERVGNRLIYSGIYNSKNSVNRTNEFISAEKITKSVNPSYGSIQKLHTRNSDLVALCEDKVLKILANKDAVFNADGNPQLIANENVLGQVIPFVGDYGISTDPGSFVSENFRAYFTDKQRGAVLRLSRDGLTAISEYGMSNYFKTNLKLYDTIVGSYDSKNDEYNVTMKMLDTTSKLNTTVSFDEKVKGWVSFKSFVGDFAFSSSSNYYSFENGILYQHDIGYYNDFYNKFTNSTVTVLFNEVPSSIKTFRTLNYEGSQAKIIEESTDVRTGYYNLNQKDGWHVTSINTDQDEGETAEFIKKEGKWFNYIKGINNII
tara:strand:- start:1492 stop:6141 length:4650 start_codon:yes stop_codon:yes gene_type:complete